MAEVDTKDEKAVRRQCSEILHTLFEHVNDRRLDPNLPFWRDCIASNYTYSGLHGNFAQFEPMDLKTHLRHLEILYPAEVTKLWIVITDLSTHREHGDLKTYMQYEVRTSPDGLIRHRAAQVKWSLVNSKLRVLEVQTMSGPEL